MEAPVGRIDCSGFGSLCIEVSVEVGTVVVPAGLGTRSPEIEEASQCTVVEELLHQSLSAED